MKKFFAVLLCAISVSTVSAQSPDFLDKGYRGFIEANAGIDVDLPAVTYGIGTTHGYQFNRWLFTGIGVEYKRAVDDDFEHILPIFADFKFYFRDHGFKPYLDGRVGYKLGFGYDTGSIYAGGGLGFDVRRFTMRASFEYFSCEAFDHGKIWSNPIYCISLNIGVNF